MLIGRNNIIMNKTNVPFELIEIFDKTLVEFKDKISINHCFETDKTLILKSNLYPDNFWFKIDLVSKVVDNKYNYTYTIKPVTENILEKIQSIATIEGIAQIFKIWVNTIDKYENTKTFLDDPFLDKYQKDIHDNFLKFADEEDDDLPYDLNTQIQFVEYLDKLEEVIKEDLNNDSVEFKNELNESLKLIGYLKENINKLTKGEVKQKFSLSLANIAKASLTYFQEIMKSAISEIAVKMITGQ